MASQKMDDAVKAPIQLRANRTVVTEVYETMQPLVRRIAYRFARRYHTDPDETLAEANYQFLRAYHSFDSRRGTTLEQRLQSYIWNRLLDQVITASTQQKTHPRESISGELTSRVEPEPFDADEVGSWVSRDARIILGLILETPPEISQRVRESFDPAPGVLKKLIRQYLRTILGWNRNRLEAAYHELRVML